MVETAHRLHEAFSQSGEPALALMRSILEKMLPMDFIVTREAAEFAAEAYIHHMCTVANLIKTCCFEGAACDLVTSLGPERFTEWKAALINHAAGKEPDLFRLLETDVRDGRFQPHPEEGALKYRSCTPDYDITELVFNDMPRLRALCTDLRRAELTAAKEADRVKAAAQEPHRKPQRNTPRTVVTDGRAAPTISGARAKAFWPHAPKTRNRTWRQAQNRWWRTMSAMSMTYSKKA
jgi:hypothetical protein